METGAVSFKSHKKVNLIHVEKNKDIIRDIVKTKTQADPDFEKDHRDYLTEIERKKNHEIKMEKVAK